MAEAASVMREAARWLIDRGQPLWSLDELEPENLVPWVRRQELYLARLHKSVCVAGTMLLLWEDSLIWPDVPPGEAGYVHKLCVRRAVAGRGVCEAMLLFARDTVTEAGIPYLRIDCDERPRLCAIYERFGFTRHSRCRVGSFDTVRYEMRVS